jgi:hypothetical protein
VCRYKFPLLFNFIKYYYLFTYLCYCFLPLSPPFSIFVLYFFFRPLSLSRTLHLLPLSFSSTPLPILLAQQRGRTEGGKPVAVKLGSFLGSIVLTFSVLHIFRRWCCCFPVKTYGHGNTP